MPKFSFSCEVMSERTFCVSSRNAFRSLDTFFTGSTKSGRMSTEMIASFQSSANKMPIVVTTITICVIEETTMDVTTL
ncbi:hypothetical protein D3C86_1439750 [compost metagenome]